MIAQFNKIPQSCKKNNLNLLKICGSSSFDFIYHFRNQLSSSAHHQHRPTQMERYICIRQKSSSSSAWKWNRELEVGCKWPFRETRPSRPPTDFLIIVFLQREDIEKHFKSTKLFHIYLYISSTWLLAWSWFCVRSFCVFVVIKLALWVQASIK